MKRIFYFIPIIFLSFIRCGSSGEIVPPFKYSDNTRIVIEGKVYLDTGVVLVNQEVELRARSGSIAGSVVVQSTVSDADGKIFVTTPRGNNSMFLTFPNKKVVQSSINNNLVFSASSSVGVSGIGFLSESYYNFGTIVLKN
jgi:hypothetical protein